MIIDCMNRMMVARDWGQYVKREEGDVGHKVQTSSYKMNNFSGASVQHGDYS